LKKVIVKNKSIFIRLSILSLLSACLLVTTLYFNLVLKTDVIYTHFFYLPIVLSSIWWGKRSVIVALFFSLVLILLHIFHISSAQPLNDLARGLSFILIAFVLGSMREKVMIKQKALEVSENKYKSLIDRSIAGIFVFREDKILFSNTRFEEILEYNTGELTGVNFWSIILENDRNKVNSFISKLTEEKTSFERFECRFITKKGKTIWLDMASSVTDFEGKQAILFNVYDITDKKEADEKQRMLVEIARKHREQLVHSTRLAELGEMAAGIAHELNQPLTGIRNFAKNAIYMIENNMNNLDEVKNNLLFISTQVDRASKIINRMREITRRSELHFTTIDLNNIIRESVEFLMPQMRLSGVKVFLDLSNQLPLITGDRIRLEQVFLNLLTNAKQAMEEKKEKKLYIRSFLQQGTIYPVVVEIEDTGIGFSREEEQKLFTPFFTTKKTGHGTGLGLSISLSIIKEHNGFIKATGEEGKGAKFTVGFPLGQQESGDGIIKEELNYL